MKKKVLLTGTTELCIDYFMGLMALSQSPTDPNWGRQTAEEWSKLVAALQGVGEIPPDKKAADFYTNDFVP
jgi:NitT/TauT family transport system substrate-binding protein